MIKEFFSRLEFGEMQSHGAVDAFPIVLPAVIGKLDYLTLIEAMEQMMLEVEEVSEGGSVPQLKAVNKSHLPVLLLAGEELKGAKQNRIVNSSMLIAALSSLVIPVSCTERGRWHYDSPGFKDSGNISNIDLRRSTNDSVSFSLDEGLGHRSDQGRVWDRIEMLHKKMGSDGTSRTRAMNDAFASRANDLEHAMNNFPYVAGQNGILFFFNGKIAGMDIISKPSAYARIHQKLVKSYLIDCLESNQSERKAELLGQEARQFLDLIVSGTNKVHNSVGLGKDIRISAQGIQGSALEYEGEYVHTCCFRTEQEDDRMADFNRRRDLH